MVVIVVVMAAMVFVYSTGLIGGLLASPQISTENISTDFYLFATTTNVTMYLRNIGGSPVTLVTYYVKDSLGNSYTRAIWPGPVANPNELVTAYVTIGSTCGGSCQLTGTAFNFTPGLYKVTVVTSHNNQFTFNVSR